MLDNQHVCGKFHKYAQPLAPLKNSSFRIVRGSFSIEPLTFGTAILTDVIISEPNTTNCQGCALFSMSPFQTSQ